MTPMLKLQSLLNVFGIGDALLGLGRAAFRHVIAVILLAAIGAAFGIIAAAFGAWGGFAMLAAVIGPARAALVIAAIFAVLALVFLGIAWRIANGSFFRRPKPAPMPAGIGGLPFAVEDVEMVIKLLKERVEDDPLATSLLGMLGGFVAGSVLFNRR